MAILREGYGLGENRVSEVKVVDSGRVNETYLVSVLDGQTYVFQKLNVYFNSVESIGENWNRVALALKGAKVGFPEIIPPKNSGWLFHEPENGAYWRLTAFLPGRKPDKDSLEEAGLSARILGLCHGALNVPKPIDLLTPLDSVEFTNQKLCSPSDFSDILNHYRGHPRLGFVTPDIKRGLDAARQLPTRPTFVRVFVARDLVIHRDCKADNFLIDENLSSLIDWDTVGYGDPLLDIGEMCRSWAVSPTKPFYRADLAAAIVAGYRESGLKLSSDDYRLLPATVRGLALNLARRYLVDALAEAYFKWDKDAYPSLYEQNLARGRHMLDLAEELLNREIELMNL
jgi:Ser/Thr protein kinase RdoA (MazF antagonist)